MLETHPFGSFVPKSARYLILGSFPGRQKFDWFYGNPRNHFWQILEKIYRTPLRNRTDKQKLLTTLRVAMADVVYRCERKHKTNSDMNLVNITYNIPMVEKILGNNNIEKIFFSSRFVENKFRRHFKKIIEKFPKIGLVTFPSPSPRFAKMSLAQKIGKYRNLLPGLV